MLSAAAFILAASPQKFPLTIESIMRGPALVGHAPRSLRWSADGKQLQFSWAKADGKDDPRYQTYIVNRDGTGLAVGSLKETPAENSPISRGSRRGDQVAYDSSGDLYLYNESTKETKRLTQTPESETNPKLTADGKAVVYVSGGNVFRMTLADSTKTQLTDVKTEPASGTASLTDTPGGPIVVNVPAGFRNGSFAISPLATHASIDLTQFPKPGKRADVPSYVTRSGFPEMIPTFERVGGAQMRSKSLVLNLETGDTVEIATTRPGRVSAIRWSPDGTHGIAYARAEDHKDDWILGFDTKTDKVSVLWDEHCDAWVGGPGRGTVGWLPDGSRFYFVSERNGFANLYTMTATGGEPKPIVEGKFEVSEVALDTERKRFTFVSSEGGPAKRHLDAVSVEGGPRKKLAELSADDDSSYAIAPNGDEVAVVRSKSNRPPELFVNNVQVTTTPTSEWLSGPWTEPPIVQVPSTDGVSVAARLYKPKNWKRGGPAAIFVHGAGYLQNVFDGWSYYYREYMFHHLLMDHGYMVLDMDYRGSAGYGRDWRTAIYRHMGGKDLDDEIAGANWLIKEQGVAKDRLGIYGGSYGGFMTLMAMFTKPGVFAAGAALRPVADWASYNHGYTSDILNLPQEDKEAYRISSPINFVEGLKGALLICHGMVDTNVPFQDSVRVVQRLIELGKTNWDVAPYPVEDHSFTHASSWTDEYRRIFALFERTIGSGWKKS